MTPAQRERIGSWIRWALALLLIPTLAMLDGRYVHVGDYDRDQARIEAKLDRILDAVCDSSQTRMCR